MIIMPVSMTAVCDGCQTFREYSYNKNISENAQGMSQSRSTAVLGHEKER